MTEVLSLEDGDSFMLLTPLISASQLPSATVIGARRAVDGRRLDRVLLQAMSELTVPPDLRKALAATPGAKGAMLAAGKRQPPAQRESGARP